MRLLGLDGAGGGERVLPEFMVDYNCRFTVAPWPVEDAHRPVLHEGLALILGATASTGSDGTGTVLHKGRRLDFRVLAEGDVAASVGHEEGVQDRAEEARAEQAARPAWNRSRRVVHWLDNAPH